ncbi:MAG: putative ABC transporter permease [Lachnospiraceae bacterium]|jgi:uncharacterized membrane protein|nr:putative ABC transporter permease [Lachnospiraceae bacterium]
MWDAKIFSTDVYHFLNWFLLYSMLGWLVESIYMSFCNKRLTNRGFVRGPICPIYGVGFLGAYFLFKPIAHNWPLLYVLGCISATALEFLVAKAMIRIFGAVWWDYKDKPFNYQGILCLESTLAWGLYAVCLFTFVHKGISWLSDSYSMTVGKVLVIAGAVYYISDFIYCVMRAKRNEGLEKDGILVKSK